MATGLLKNSKQVRPNYAKNCYYLHPTNKLLMHLDDAHTITMNYTDYILLKLLCKKNTHILYAIYLCMRRPYKYHLSCNCFFPLFSIILIFPPTSFFPAPSALYSKLVSKPRYPVAITGEPPPLPPPRPSLGFC